MSTSSFNRQLACCSIILLSIFSLYSFGEARSHTFSPKKNVIQRKQKKTVTTPSHKSSNHFSHHPSGWLFELPKGRKGFNESTAEVSGSCFDKNGELWSIGDAGVNGQKLSQSHFNSKGELVKQKVYFITSYNRDMEWIVCDKKNNTLIIGDTGDNLHTRGLDVSKLKNSFMEKQKTYHSKRARYNQHHSTAPLLDSKKRNKELNAMEGQLQRAWIKLKNYFLKTREARIYVYNITPSTMTTSYDGKTYLKREGFLKLKYKGGPMDVEAAVLKNNKGSQSLYLFEKTNPFSLVPFAKVVKLNLTQNIEHNTRLKTAVPFTTPHEVQKLQLSVDYKRHLFITDATLSQDESTLYLLTNNAVVRYKNWESKQTNKKAWIKELPEPLKYANLQLESISLHKKPDGTFSIIMGSDYGNFFVSFEQFFLDENLSHDEKKKFDWKPLLISSTLKPQLKFRSKSL